MIVSHKHRFVFIHNPKCAGTSFRQQIVQYHDDETTFWGYEVSPHLGIQLDLAHLRLWELASLRRPLMRRISGYRSAVFVRNPFRRLVSSLMEHIRNFRPQLGFQALDKAGQIDATLHILRELTPERLITDFRYVHFSPQYWYICLPGEPPAWTVLPLLDDPESLLAGFDTLGVPRGTPERLNRASYDHAHLLNDPRLLLFALEFYKADFELFRKLGLPEQITALPAASPMPSAA